MAAVLSPQMEIRAMCRLDLSAVTAIERASYPFPWTRGIFHDCLRVGYRCHVLVDNGVIRGYGIVSDALEEAHLLNLCIDPDRRRAGLAGIILNHLMDEARIYRAERMYLEVRPSNEGALALYRRYGFRVIGRRPGYYPGEQEREDAVVMVRQLDTEHG